MTITIEIYPDCPKPDWMEVGAWCYCLGEGNDKYIVDQVFDVSATLLTGDGLYLHGRESFNKLYRSMDELEQRRPELK